MFYDKLGIKFGVFVVGTALGFGAGRVKNKQKLAVVDSAVSKLETVVAKKI